MISEIRSRSSRLPLSHVLGIVGIGLLVANCSSNPGARRQASREVGAFPESKYGPASPRVVAVGEPVPKGGGRELVGKTYSVAGRSYTPRENPTYSAVGNASWYGEAFHGRRTANGEIYDMASISAAHPTMPLPSYARVTNVGNRRSIIVRVNDRGPYHGNRIMDVSERVAYYLDFKRFGTAKVKVDYIGKASVAGSDDRKLLATLRTDGDVAPSPVGRNPILVASADVDSSAAPVQSEALRAPITQPPAFLASADPQIESPVVARATPPVRIAGVPLPPDRPFETGAGARGGFVASPPARALPPLTAIAAAPKGEPALGFAQAASPPATLPAAFNSSAQLAALYYAPPIDARSRFGQRSDPLARLKTTGLISFSETGSLQPTRLIVVAGVFRDAANAKRLAATLGATAAIKQVSGQGGTVFQVSAGPFASQAQARAVIEQAVRAGAKDARIAAHQG